MIGLELVREFSRCVREADPDWFLMENTPGVPRIAIEGYAMQRFFLTAAECGGRQRRRRLFQFGSRDAGVVICDRSVTVGALERTCLAGEGKTPRHLNFGNVTHRRSWSEFCQLQGLPGNFQLDHMCVRERYRAVGNGVPVYMAAVVAAAIRDRRPASTVTVCDCGCARAVAGKAWLATAACRKRAERTRKGPAPVQV